MKMIPEQCDVAIIGGGPSGALAAAMLVRQGYDVVILERDSFPRFSIGESLLPQSMIFLQQAGLLDAVESAGFQRKEGAAFRCDTKFDEFNFEEKFTEGFGYTYQVERAEFDKILVDQAEEYGAKVFYNIEVVAADFSEEPLLTYKDHNDELHKINAKFVLDASGFGRVLPRLLELDRPSCFPVRQSIFSHFVDHIDAEGFDRNKILITVHHKYHDVWFWLIPFSNGRSSVGVVARPELLHEFGTTDSQILLRLIEEDPNLSVILGSAELFFTPRKLTGYSCNVSTLHGKGFALLGNAGEFLDPVFSSGITIALKSANLASNCVDQQLRGEAVDWQAEYAENLMQGVNTFRHFVEAWYDTRLQSIIFSPKKRKDVKAMISSILAGYAWDTSNPYVAESKRRVDVLAKLCEQY
ncbi:MAG: tryptophan 7-halogenase [Pseudomonadales bacterium]|nr:tryptophan 7-halogenase [Pseudomonadales bacterium]